VGVAVCTVLAGCAETKNSVASATYDGTPTVAAGTPDIPTSPAGHPFGAVSWVDNDRMAFTTRMYSNCEAVPVSITVLSSREINITFIPSQSRWPCTGNSRTVTYEFLVPAEISRTRSVRVDAFNGSIELKPAVSVMAPE
jgi:hypothetical protein